MLIAISWLFINKLLVCGYDVKWLISDRIGRIENNTPSILKRRDKLEDILTLSEVVDLT